MPRPDPFVPADDEARKIARDLLDGATHAALATLRPGKVSPSVTRIAMATGPDGWPLSLVSSLSTHTPALEANPTCALLIGDPPQKGDPLAFPRLTLHCETEFVGHDHPDRPALRDHFLTQRPKTKLYIDFPDFRFVRFTVTDGLLNGGFAKAYTLTPDDLG